MQAPLLSNVSHKSYKLIEVTSKPHVHSCGHSHSHTGKKKKPTRELTAEFDKIRMFLESHFGSVSDLRTQMKEGPEDEDELLTLDVELDGVKASVDLISMVSPRLINTDERMSSVNRKSCDIGSKRSSRWLLPR